MFSLTKIDLLLSKRKELFKSECPINLPALRLLEEPFLYLHIYKQITSQNRRESAKRENLATSVSYLHRLLNNNHFVNVDSWETVAQITKDIDNLVDRLENTSDFPMLKYKPRTHLVALIEGFFVPPQRSTYEKKRALGSYLLAYIKIREDKNINNWPPKFMKFTKETYTKHLKIFKRNRNKIEAERNQFIEFVKINLKDYIRREKILNHEAFFYEHEAPESP